MCRVCLLLTAILLASAATAEAAFFQFQTPSHNIGCGYSSAGSGTGFVRCDVLQQDNPIRKKRPKHCFEGDYGGSYGVGEKGHGRRLCVSDAVYDPKSKVLAYGKKFKRRGITCTSRESGLTCKNRHGHGFTLSRSAQSVF